MGEAFLLFIFLNRKPFCDRLSQYSDKIDSKGDEYQALRDLKLSIIIYLFDFIAMSFSNKMIEWEWASKYGKMSKKALRAVKANS